MKLSPKHLVNFLNNRFESRWTGLVGLLGTTGLLIGYIAVAALIYAEEAQMQNREVEIVALEESSHKVHELVESLETKRNQHREALAKLRDRVPANADVSLLLREVANVFAKNKLQLKEFRPGAKSQFEKFSEIELIIKADGSYSQICCALKDLLALPWNTRLTSLMLSANPDLKDCVNVDVSVAVSTDLKL